MYKIVIINGSVVSAMLRNCAVSFISSITREKCAHFKANLILLLKKEYASATGCVA